MIKGVDVSDPTCNFTSNKCTILRWNGGQVYVAQARERMNRRGRGGRCGGHDGGREYGHGVGPRKVRELNINNSGGHDEVHKGG